MTAGPAIVHRARETALWVGALLGVLCLLLVAAAWIFDLRLLVFRSGSMSPAIEAGAVAVARDVPASELAVGDVVSVTTAQNVRVTHRVVGIEPAGDAVGLRLRGDANARPDAETYTVDRAYRVVGDVPWAGHLVDAASTPWGLLLCGGFVTLLLVSAFGGGRAGRGEDGGAGSSASRSPTRRGTAGVAGVALVALGTGLSGMPGVPAPVATMATFSDSAVVTGGSLTALTVPVPGTPSCASSGPLTPGIDITWTHVHAGATYVFEVRRRNDNALVSTTPVTPTGPVGSRQKVVVNPNTYGTSINTDYTAFLRSRVATWESASTAGIRFRTGLLNGFVYCGWGL